MIQNVDGCYQILVAGGDGEIVAPVFPSPQTQLVDGQLVNFGRVIPMGSEVHMSGAGPDAPVTDLQRKQAGLPQDCPADRIWYVGMITIGE